ncbi:MAG: glycosyltransferase family 2 protein [Acidimicrobiales bacterium]
MGEPIGHGLAIVPAFNEMETIGSTLHRLKAALPGLDVLVIDDGSDDDTARIARAAGAMVVQLPYNLGIGGALRTGFRFAQRRRYDWAVQVDADGQHDPEQLRALLSPLHDGADLVVGSRFATGSGTYEVRGVRRRAMSLLRITLRVLLGRSFTDTSSGFRAFSPRCLDYFARSYPAEYMESVEALLMACYAGLHVVEVPVTMHQREGGVASNRRWRLIYHYLRIYVVLVSSASRRRRPRFREAEHP